MQKIIRSVVAFASLVSAPACTGEIAPADRGSKEEPGGPTDLGDLGKDPSVARACASSTPSPGPSFVRRLNRFEYVNTVRDLIGVSDVDTNGFPADEKRLGFDNNAVALTVSPVLAEQYLLTAENLAAKAAQRLDQLAPCSTNVSTSNEKACVEDFIRSFGKRAFRRPVTSAEQARALRVYDTGRTGADVRNGLKLVIESFLLAPPFLYRLEEQTEARDGWRKLTPFETASRLSYLLWGTMPDDTLLAAAEAGKLSSRAEIDAQAARMMKDPRAKNATTQFLRQWLQLDKLATMEKDDKVVTGWSADLRERMMEEATRFVSDVAGPEGTLEALLSAPHTFVDAKLGTFYGLSDVGGSGYMRVTKPQGMKPAAGLLSNGAILAMLAKSNQTDPVHRGKYIREQLLCGQLPAPPADVEIVVPSLDNNLTTRERFTRHATDPACSGCHALMDPLGLGLETFDAAGRFRATENGKTIDASGELVSTDVDGRFSGPEELAARLAESLDVRSCVARQWFRYAFGRAETEADACTVARLEATFGQEGRFDALYRAPIATDAFVYGSVEGGSR